MFHGKEDRMLDEKGRISFNRRVREELGNMPLITKRGKKALLIFPEQKKDEFKPYQIWIDKVDKQGRLRIPSKLLSGFFNKKRIILLGKGDHIELRFDQTGMGV